MKKIAICLIFMAIYIVAIALLAVPMVAEVHFDAAERLVSHYKWLQAEEEFENAIRIDPLNARYPAALADFFIMQTKHTYNRKPLFDRAKALYGRAIRLDPKNAEYYLSIGVILAAEKSFADAFRYFRMAQGHDPKGFNVSYLTGVAGVGNWRRLDDRERGYILDRFKTAIRARPSAADDIYMRLWGAGKDIELLRKATPDNSQGQISLYNFIVSHDLWSLRKDQAAKVGESLRKEHPKAFEAEMTEKSKRIKKVKEIYGDRVRLAKSDGNKVSKSDWHGIANGNAAEFKYGDMYWSGTIDAVVDVPAGEVVVSIMARGDNAGRSFPYMIVELDGEEIGEMLVTKDWKKYEFKVNTGGGIKVLSVTFVNDRCDVAGDVNLYIGTAEIVGIKEISGKG